MKSSLSVRLLVAAMLSTIVALVATGLILNALFRGYFEERIQSEIEAFLTQLTSSITIDADGMPEVVGLFDPRFSEPLSGYYWQAQVPNNPPTLSPSVWSEPMQIPPSKNLGQIEFHSVGLGGGEIVLAGSWTVTLQSENGPQPLTISVALNQTEYLESASGFSINVAIALGVLGAFLVLAAGLQVNVGLKPLERVRSEVHSVKKQKVARLMNDYPSEVEPLVDEVNDLLDQRDASLERARARSADMAHGLKTPLTIMRAISQDLRGHDLTGLAEDVDAQVDNMQHFVERELARTRDDDGLVSWSHAAPVVEKMVRALQKRADADGIKWDYDVDANVRCPFDQFALTELLGNLIDNAIKWTKDEILISVKVVGSTGCLSVKDNGPGVPEASLASLTQRGEKLQSDSPGQGLGLAIVSDMVIARGARFDPQNRENGGLDARVLWTVV